MQAQRKPDRVQIALVRVYPGLTALCRYPRFVAVSWSRMHITPRNCRRVACMKMLKDEQRTGAVSVVSCRIVGLGSSVDCMKHCVLRSFQIIDYVITDHGQCIKSGLTHQYGLRDCHQHTSPLLFHILSLRDLVFQSRLLDILSSIIAVETNKTHTQTRQ